MRIAEMLNIQKFLTLVAWRKQKWSQTKKKKHKKSVKSIIFLLFFRKLHLVSII